MLKKSKIKMSSNRNFGLVFFAVFLFLSFWLKSNSEVMNFWLMGISLIFLILGLTNSKILTPLNHLWFKFGIILGAVVAPIVMAAVFFLVVTPIGLFMRIMGKDLLNKKYEKKKETYWIKRDKSIGTMKRQF
jgi:hypothetical protein|tara:strand:+ start:120 stop:515 length:396 start_codon:yes stop_codon:yes gene_type:complete